MAHQRRKELKSQDWELEALVEKHSVSFDAKMNEFNEDFLTLKKAEKVEFLTSAFNFAKENAEMSELAWCNQLNSLVNVYLVEKQSPSEISEYYELIWRPKSNIGVINN